MFILFLFFQNFLLKIEPSEITPFFYNNFFGFGGGGFPPWLRPLFGGYPETAKTCCYLPEL